MRVENSSLKYASLCPETSTKNVVKEFHSWTVQVELTTLLARQRKGREKEQAMSRKVKILFYSFLSLSICRFFLTLTSFLTYFFINAGEHLLIS
jgi:hypothetical protein